MYLLQLRHVLLKDLRAIPLKCNHQEGQGLCLSGCVGGKNPNLENCQLADTAGLITITLTNAL